ncbi:hypothetical protein D9758_014296 [Tetrapyrgos nigripes]|uniref:Mucoidy inhibitor A n=1 Tax=Tetrapyrgos nigripes TaxID=182062 RepID=A0A8H5FFT6_9AGAR|nr:hypothetical protein D9758_014296 [Tetrapyrgos nigripes]
MSSASSSDGSERGFALYAATESKILGIRLYTTKRAEVTREFTFDVKQGQNRVHLEGISAFMDQDSVRVEARGPATIHDVSISKLPSNNLQAITMSGLKRRRSELEDRMKVLRNTQNSLASYLSTMNAQSTPPEHVEDFVKTYARLSDDIHQKLQEVEEELQDVEECITEENSLEYRRIEGFQVSVELWSDMEGKMELVLSYAVTEAFWRPAYEIRVDTNQQQAPVTVIYKAVISQSTGEAWSDAPLTLETVTPRQNFTMAEFGTWDITVSNPHQVTSPTRKRKSTASTRPRKRGRFLDVEPEAPEEEDADAEDDDYVEDDKDTTMHHTTLVPSGSHFIPPFQIPGSVTIPSRRRSQNFTIAQLHLKADLIWECLPKQDSRVYMKAKIHNDSAYAFLLGQAHVFVDKSFVSKVCLRPVNPAESFNLSLGVDPYIQVGYHPCGKEVTNSNPMSGFLSKATSATYTRKMSISNKGRAPISLLRVLDNIPVSDDSQITVKLLQPALKLPTLPLPTISSPSTSTSTISAFTTSNSTNGIPVLSLGEGVSAQWYAAEQALAGTASTSELERIGRDGKISWLIEELKPQATVDLVLQWEISAESLDLSQILGV